MTTKNRLIAHTVMAAALVAAGGAAHAATSFVWDAADSTYSNTSLGTLTVALTSWANTGTIGDNNDGNASSVWRNQSGSGSGLVLYSAYNLGVKSKLGNDAYADSVEDNSPNHALDNAGAQEFILFAFSEKVALNQLAIGWPDDGSTIDTDMTVAAYTGALDLATTFGNFSSNTMTAANGFTYIEHLANVAKDTAGSPSWGTPSSFNAGNVESKYWLVGAYNHHLGGSLTANNDAVKLALVGGKVLDCSDRGNCPPPPGNGVPEPTTLGLLGLGMIGLRYSKRFRKS